METFERKIAQQKVINKQEIVYFWVTATTHLCSAILYTLENDMHTNLWSKSWYKQKVFIKFMKEKFKNEKNFEN
jgi:hypothetical protein